MHQPTSQPLTLTSKLQSRLKPRRFVAGALALASLLTVQSPAQAQAVGASGERCYTVADNNPPGGNSGGLDIDDTLVQVNFGNRTAVIVGNGKIPRAGSSANIQDIEAMTSRPNFNELIAANASEFGRINPDTGVFTTLGTLGIFNDFDGITIDRNSTNQTRILAVSKDLNRTPALHNFLVEADILLNANGESVGISAPIRQVKVTNFPSGTNSIDGIVLVGNTLYAIANPSSEGPGFRQILVTIDRTTGVITEVGSFRNIDGSLLNDVEDIELSLYGTLFGSTGSNFNRGVQSSAYVFDFTGRASDRLDLTAVGSDYEASACVTNSAAGVPQNLLIVKRITAVTRAGVEERFNDFVDQAGEDADNQLLAATANVFPRGIVQASATPTPLNAGDQVEYTVYIYNPTNQFFNNSVLCDAITPPGILQSNSVEFAAPTSTLSTPLAFANQAGSAQAPLAPVPASGVCAPLLGAAQQFPFGPPGPSGGANIGAGGGIVTDAFNINPSQVAALRFRITVGQSATTP
ncbi:MAG: hypothetical protein DCF15_15780 [Phormidesmis priestleyi]|uniref:DUF11 domain-containing protein n=1 Tax=Phormidesmis priestleyi TaxID=268141 RepID=A0A2W4WZF5_9CYAN|nr:MAG: hypothetical protein DCF15_15780 [Phormidesmis priestleyi]